ncbi:MAG: hypothetical protein ACTSPY_18340 [Candidatus Helarchaeota archaeon]
MEVFTERLIRTVAADFRQTMIDSTKLYARKDDSDIIIIKTKHEILDYVIKLRDYMILNKHHFWLSGGWE